MGIPYATPPVGELRWRAPRAPRPWSGVRDATVAGPWCAQVGWDEAGNPSGVAGSEDCLFLNVHTPRRPAGRLPVMVVLHGGGFVGGSGALYNPTRIVTRGNVIVVTINYRLGALGFLDHPSMGDPAVGNFGLADQQAALRWVHRNIAAFGGNPANVTLWGESAGAFSVCAQLASPGARGLFHKAIVQSGPCWNPLGTHEVARPRALRTAAELGCANAGSAVSCLRSKPVEDLVGLEQESVGVVSRTIAELPWLPVGGTSTLPVQPRTALRLGLAARVPLIHGGTRDEMREFVANTYDPLTNPVTAADYPRIVGELFGDDAAAILAEYPVADYPTPALALATLLGDYGGAVGSCAQLPAIDAAARWSPVFTYEFAEPDPDVIGDFPLGARHGFDVRYFFSSFNPENSGGLTGDQKILADRLVDHWTRFATTGAPGRDWAAYQRDAVALSFATADIAPVDVAAEHHCGFWRSRL